MSQESTKNTDKNDKQQETFIAYATEGREKSAVPPIVPPIVDKAKSLKEDLSELRLVKNILILDANNELVDSQKLIGIDKRPALIALAINQIHDISLSINTQPHAGIFNNLGCAYAMLGDNTEAKEALQKATHVTTPDINGAKDAATFNLTIVIAIESKK